MKSLELQYVSGLIDNSVGTKRGKTATVSMVTMNGRKYAFKKYRPNAVEDLSAMEKHICSLFDCLGELKYNEMMLFGAFPKYLVYDQNSFCGFLMDKIPKECYTEDHQDRHLGAFYGIQGEVNKFSDQQIGQYVKNLGNLIYDLHESGFILGDALNDQNLYIRVMDNQLFPYLVDTDSLRKDQANPAKTYHSPNFEPPEGEDSPSSKASDIYKYCLIVLRLFSKPEKEYERAGLRIGDPAAAGSLQRIQKTLGDGYKDVIVKGLMDNPSQRPRIREVLQAFTPQKRPSPEKRPFPKNGKKILPDDPCPCGSGKKYKSCCGMAKNVPEATDVINMIGRIGKVVYTDEFKRKLQEARNAYVKLSYSQKELVPRSIYSKLTKAEVEYKALKDEHDKSILKWVKRANGSLIFNLIAAIMLIAVMVFSNFEAVNIPWYYFLAFIPIAVILFYSFSVGLWQEDHGCWLWTKYDTILMLLLVFVNIIAWLQQSILSGNLMVSQAYVIILHAYNVPVLSITTMRNLEIIKKKGKTDGWLEKYKEISVVLYSILSVLLVCSIINGLKALNPLNVGNSLTFGTYEQDGKLENGSEKISWTVHEIKDGKALLLCDTCLETMQYNQNGTDNSWKNSDIRHWLNEEFYDSAFSDDERSMIIENEISTGRLSDKEGHTFGETYGEDEVTTDRVFVPDLSEFWQVTSELVVSERAKADFVANNIRWGQKDFQTMFWIRCPYGESKNYAYGYDTARNQSMAYVFTPETYALVRPAVYIDVERYADFVKNGND